MFNSEQIQQLAGLIIESGIDTKNQEEVTECLGLLLEDIAGCERLSDTKFAEIQFQIHSVLNHL